MDKRYLYIIFLVLINLNVAFADKRSDVKTPAGSSVEAWICDEMSASQRAIFDNDAISSYPNAFIIKNGSYSSTNTYNCHGYAWHITEGGDTRWIGYERMTDEDIYMTDGSYEEVYSGTSPRKVSYASSDHSAVTTDQDGWFISKWANRPLMRHRYDDCPFNSTSLRYYIKSSLFKMEGNTSICNGGTNGYSINYQPKNPITWSVSSGLQIVSGQGTTSVIVKATTSSKTQGSITVKFGKKTISKSISINGVDVASITGPTQVKLNTTQTYTANPNYWFDNMDWRWEVATSVYPKPMYSTINSQLTVSFTQEGSYTLRCWVQSPCGVSTGTGYLYVMVGRYYSVQLDPQINLLSISKNDDFISGYNLLPKALCTYELISVERGVIVSSGTFNADNGLSTYVNNLSKGAYVLKITSGDGKIETHKLNY